MSLELRVWARLKKTNFAQKIVEFSALIDIISIFGSEYFVDHFGMKKFEKSYQKTSLEIEKKKFIQPNSKFTKSNGFFVIFVFVQY